jgi:hypothetical protein
MPARRWIVGGALAAIVLAGCGGSGHNSATATATTSAATPPPPSGNIQSRALAEGELAGVAVAGRPVAVNSPESWVVVDELPASRRTSEAQRLRRLGFVAGVREPLVAAAGSQTAGLSIVEQFRSPGSARSQLAAEYRQSTASGGHVTVFAVPAIPGARGFELASSGFSGANVVFAKGPYYYLVGEQAEGSSRANVTAAAQHLFDRVSE